MPKDGDGDASAPLQFNTLKFHALPILNSCMKDRCGFLLSVISGAVVQSWSGWEDAACPLSGIKKRPLVGG